MIYLAGSVITDNKELFETIKKKLGEDQVKFLKEVKEAVELSNRTGNQETLATILSQQNIKGGNYITRKFKISILTCNIQSANKNFDTVKDLIHKLELPKIINLVY